MSTNRRPAMRHEHSLISEILSPTKTEDLAFYRLVDVEQTRQSDQHVVCIILNPITDEVAWVLNDKYETGKPRGYGLIGGRLDYIGEIPENRALIEAYKESGMLIEILEEIVSGLVCNQKNNRHYWRTIFLCVAMNDIDPKVKEYSENGNAQTLGSKWFPALESPDAKKIGEFVYPKHKETLLHPIVQIAISEATLRHKDKIAHAKFLWESGYKNYNYDVVALLSSPI